jgi:four helix bundle protein
MDQKFITHKDLDVWKLGIELVEKIYTVTKTFPKEEIYGLTSQIRRSAVSIPSNIAEGAARNSKKEFLQFLYFSLGSIAELETQLIISQRLEYLDGPELFESIEIIRRKLLNFIKYIKQRNNEG